MSPLGPALLFAVGLFVTRVCATSVHEDAPAADTSELQCGILPNGFRYALLPRATETGRISLRLIVHAGSLDEHDDELGYAHFVEHMAFNGTRHYLPGKLVPFFQRLGLAWGADANAETSFTSTIYKLDLPANHAAHLAEAIQIFRDFADGIAFARGEVKREKGVIVSEINARETNRWQLAIKRLSAFYSDSIVPSRFPLANSAAIRQATATRLRAFYRRCYRPERMTLLITGDITAEAATPLIEQNFSSLSTTEPHVAPVLPRLPAGHDLRAHVLGNSNATAAVASLTCITPISSDASARHADDLADYVILRALDRRIKERQRQMADQIGEAGTFRKREIDGRFRQFGLEVQAKASAWSAAVSLIENELRRARETGFSTAEIHEMSASLLAAAHAVRDAGSRITPVQLANELAGFLALDADWQSPSERLADVEAWVPHFTPEAALAAVRSMFPDDRLHLLLILRQPEKVAPAALLAAYRDSAAQPLATVSAPAADELRFLYDDFGPAGRVTTQRSEPDLGLELVEFANGTRLNLRPSDSEPNHFKLVAHLGRGIADVPRDRPGLHFLAGALLGACDLHRHTRGELGRLIRLHAIDAGVNYSWDRFTVELAGPSAELPFALRFLAAFLSDAKFEESKMPDAISRYTSTRAFLCGSGQTLSLLNLNFHLRADDPRFQFPPPTDVERYPFAEVVSWIRTRWLEGPIEIALAGNFDPQMAIDVTAATVGALPPRHEATPLRDDERAVFLTKLHRNLSVVPLADHAATVQFAWIAKDLANVRTLRALLFANSALADRLRVKLREERGATYSPIGRVVREAAQPDFGFANIEITFDSKKAKGLSERVLKMADELARRGLTPQEFSRLRAPLIARAAENLQRNSWWLDEVLSRAQSQPTVLDAARTLTSDFASLTLEEVNRVAATHYRFAKANVVGIIPADAKPAAPATKR